MAIVYAEWFKKRHPGKNKPAIFTEAFCSIRSSSPSPEGCHDGGVNLSIVNPNTGFSEKVSVWLSQDEASELAAMLLAAVTISKGGKC